MNDKIYFITYGEGKRYDRVLKRITTEAKKSGFFSQIESFNSTNLTPEFKQKYKNVLCQKRGAGYWIWKVDIIKNKLNNMQKGEYLVYLDAGCTINKLGKKRFEEYIEILKKSKYGIIDFEARAGKQKRQCTKQVFDYFELDPESVKRGITLPGVLIIKKNEHSVLIMEKFLEVLDFDEKLVTDYYNKQKQHPSYWAHRHDQSIFTCLFIKYGSEIIQRNESWDFEDDPVKGGNFGGKNSLKYPFWATRKR
jgi:hypothetical protein